VSETIRTGRAGISTRRPSASSTRRGHAGDSAAVWPSFTAPEMIAAAGRNAAEVADRVGAVAVAVGVGVAVAVAAAVAVLVAVLVVVRAAVLVAVDAAPAEAAALTSTPTPRASASRATPRRHALRLAAERRPGRQRTEGRSTCTTVHAATAPRRCRQKIRARAPLRPAAVLIRSPSPPCRAPSSSTSMV
jgi:hypothetical protein